MVFFCLGEFMEQLLRGFLRTGQANLEGDYKSYLFIQQKADNIFCRVFVYEFNPGGHLCIKVSIS